MNVINCTPNEKKNQSKKDNHLIIPTVTSQKSSKIGASIFNQSAMSIKQMNANSTPQCSKQQHDKLKNVGGGLDVNAFSLTGVNGIPSGGVSGLFLKVSDQSQKNVNNNNSNIKASLRRKMSLTKQNLFSEVKGFHRSSESMKSSIDHNNKPNGNHLSSFLQLGAHNSPKNHIENEEASCNNEDIQNHPQSLQDLCQNMSHHQISFKQARNQ